MKRPIWIAVCAVTLGAGTMTLPLPVYAAAEPTVQLGSQNSAVKTLQGDLRSLGYFDTSVTGYFGSQTKAAVVSFQRSNHLTADGIVGPMTWAALLGSLSSRASSGSSPGSSVGATGTKSSVPGLTAKPIIVNGASLMTMDSFVHGGTTYMPVSSMIQMLNHLNIQSTWTHQQWNLTVPASVTVDLNNIHLPSGSSGIALNGTTVMRVNALSNTDPSNPKAETDYLPIYDVGLVLNRVGVVSDWNGAAWTLDVPSSLMAASGTAQSGGGTSSSGGSSGSGSSGGGNSGGETTPAYPPLAAKSVVFNGKSIATVQAFAQGGTTYMPVDSLSNVLSQLGVQTKWSGSVWQWTFPSSFSLDLSDLSVPAGTVSITFNGTTVMRATPETNVDPNQAGATVDYVPIYNLQQALKRAGIQSTWDGATWTMSTVASGYTTFSKAGKPLSTYATAAAAESAVASDAGAYVEDPSGKKVYTVPDFEAFSGPGQLQGDYTTQSAAAAAVAQQSNGYVVDAVKGTVVKMPSNTYTVNSSGDWTSTAYGWLGTFTPAWAQSGDVFLVTDSSNSPYMNQFFLLSQNGKYVGKNEGTFENPFRTVDLRFAAPASVTAAQIDGFYAENNSPLQGLGQAIIEAQNTYGVNATYLLAHAIEETGWGKSLIAEQKNNLFGYGAFDSNPGPDAGMFPSNEYAIIFQAWEVRNNYLNPGSSNFYQTPTLDGMNEHYATSHTWSTSIATLMNEFMSQTNGSISGYTQYAPSNNAPTPAVTVEPVYQMNGATGTVLANPSKNLPVYPLPGVSSEAAFPGTLANGSSGVAVRELQEALNQNGANLTVDGSYGPLTAAAVSAYQASHQLSVTGICTQDVWNSLFPNSASASVPSLPVGSTVTIDEMEQGMDGGLVTEWYHITAGSISGWVDSSYVQFTNVYRAMAKSGYSIPVYSSESASGTPVMTLHTGDFVVAPSPSADAKGFITVQLVNQNNNNGTTYTNEGQAFTGYISAANASLAALAQSASGTS
ncbi:peptidoglycan-binding protein [Alicyclobacillus cycloheptanicus]|uniref:Peptidoglycan hydrolase-like protein with peptidoglycan-binding domain/beta-N-acetylglucosaminidase n=1 Tax=Alicyclobacillus cycloheptanicus TaxID=1457 RepID=A0ABT9XLK8_9BACL|nr:peptidoglycan-binding protein [Alicyclobacillus cycloheptanicus]MDQ0191000.1 peptidoglycan hydrolase-like protein with peptidoglycan-binding domain/beta-N-acetylglucosaminidase [Alicyclobacillus cycloheptanicus]WDM00894.1 peptidoglycan-binding protein [Alicyclobacillus cycloheptanicus]